MRGADHDHLHVSAALAERVDPTGTTTLRERRFKPALTKRYRGVRGAVRTTVQENDALGLTSGTGWGFSAALAREDIRTREQFRARDDAAREEAFLRWFENAIEDGVLEPTTGRRVRNGQHYSAEYIEEAYRKGIRDGASQARAAGEQAPEEGSGAIFAAASSVTLAALFHRAYRAIRGTVTTTQKDVARVFDDHYPHAGKATLTREINRAIADGGEKNAVDVARTEPIYAYTEGQLDQFEELGIEEVGFDPEVQLSTAGDSRVCERCRRKAAQGPYTIEEIRRNPRDLHPPIHVRCRCGLKLVV